MNKRKLSDFRKENLEEVCNKVVSMLDSKKMYISKNLENAKYNISIRVNYCPVCKQGRIIIYKKSGLGSDAYLKYMHSYEFGSDFYELYNLQNAKNKKMRTVDAHSSNDSYNDVDKNRKVDNIALDRQYDDAIKMLKGDSYSTDHNRICPNCNASLPYDGVYCPNCGMNVTDYKEIPQDGIIAESSEENDLKNKNIISDKTLDQLHKIKQLYDEEVLSEDEFQRLKKQLLKL